MFLSSCNSGLGLGSWLVEATGRRVVCGVGALCLFFPRCRLFVGAVSRFSAESRVVAAHLRVSLHYCVSLAWAVRLHYRVSLVWVVSCITA